MTPTARAAAERIAGNTNGYNADSVAVARAYLALTTPAEDAAEVARAVYTDMAPCSSHAQALRILAEAMARCGDARAEEEREANIKSICPLCRDGAATDEHGFHEVSYTSGARQLCRAAAIRSRRP